MAAELQLLPQLRFDYVMVAELQLPLQSRPHASLVLQGAYEAPRQQANVTMMVALESLGHVFAPQTGAVSSLRSAGLAMLNASGPAKQQIMRYAMG